MFGNNYWRHVCIVISHFSNRPEVVKQREAQGITREVKTKQVLDILEKKFPDLVIEGKRPNVYFTDSFDLGEEFDITREQARLIVKEACTNAHYDTVKMHACLCPDWREKRASLV